MIYFLQAEVIGRIKIGYAAADRLEHRISCLRVASPVPLKLLGAIRGNRAKERRLHLRFADARVCGEWFEPSPVLARYIARIQGRVRPQKRVNRCDVASSWIMQKFGEQTEWNSVELLELAARDGISRPAMFEAKKALKIRSHSMIGSHGRCWRLQ